MATFGRESGSFTDRGFSSVDANGYLAKFYTWVTKTPANHGPGWYILDEQVSLTALTTAYTNVNTTSEEITITSHGLATGRAVLFTQGDTTIGGLTTGTTYYVIRVDANTIKISTSEGDALAGTAINLTSQGTGTHTFTPRDPHIIVSDVAAPALNAYSSGQTGGAPKILKVGYVTTESGYIRVQALMAYDVTNRVPRGYFGGLRVSVGSSAEYAYYFGGGAECMLLAARQGTSWTYLFLDEFTGISSVLEAADKVGVLQSGVTAGSSVVCQLGAGQAANFTVGKSYFIFDFNGHTWVDYVQVTARNTSSDTITLESVEANFPSGSVLSPYAHRYYMGGNNSTSSSNMSNNAAGEYAPYLSCYASSRSCHSQWFNISGKFEDIFLGGTFYQKSPDDDNKYYCTPHLLLEFQSHNNSSAGQDGVNRLLGKTKNLLRTKAFGAQMQDYRTVNGIDYINLNGGSPECTIFRYSEATS